MPSGELVERELKVPCGKCNACMLTRQQMWRIRLNEEFKASDGAIFFTLTYNPENLPFHAEFDVDSLKEFISSTTVDRSGRKKLLSKYIRDMYHRPVTRVFSNPRFFNRIVRYNDSECSLELDNGVKYNAVVYRKDIQDFMKRLRKSLQPLKVRFFCSSEYTPLNHRPHYHGIIFNYPYDRNLPKEKVLKEVHDHIEATWKNGFVSVDFCNGPRCNYCAKYCVKPVDTLSIQRPSPFILCSRRPAIGAAYFERLDRVAWHLEQHNTTYVADNFSKNSKPFKTKLPKYYVDKIFSDPGLRAEQSLYERIQRLFDESYPFDRIHDLTDSEYDSREQELEEEAEREYRKRPGSVLEKLSAKRARNQKIVNRSHKGGLGSNRMK